MTPAEALDRLDALAAKWRKAEVELLATPPSETQLHNLRIREARDARYLYQESLREHGEALVAVARAGMAMREYGGCNVSQVNDAFDAAIAKLEKP